MGKIEVNTDEGKRVIAEKQLRPAKINNMISQLTDFIALESPTAAQRLAQQKLQARILKRILNRMREG